MSPVVVASIIIIIGVWTGLMLLTLLAKLSKRKLHKDLGDMAKCQFDMFSSTMNAVLSEDGENKPRYIKLLLKGPYDNDIEEIIISKNVYEYLKELSNVVCRVIALEICKTMDDAMRTTKSWDVFRLFRASFNECAISNNLTATLDKKAKDIAREYIRDPESVIVHNVLADYRNYEGANDDVMDDVIAILIAYLESKNIIVGEVLIGEWETLQKCI